MNKHNWYGENNPNYKHGLKGTRLYNIWQGMKQRCLNPKNIKYHNYGGRGITVCDEWKNNFMQFYNWAINNGYDENKSRKEQSLDRINNNDNYGPHNCRWVTHSENCRNRNDNVYISRQNECKSIYEWSEITGINPYTLSNRAKKYNKEEDIFFQGNLYYKKHKTNTNEYGIRKCGKNSYVLVLKRKHIGTFKTLEDAINEREKILNDK